MQPERIQDLPQFRQLLDQMDQLETFQEALPILQPFLEKMNINPNEFEPIFAELMELKRQATEIAQVPDRFNTLFSERGWTIFELMNHEVAKDAISIAEKGDFDEAERVLVRYFNVDTIQFLLNRMKNIKSFQPRSTLARKALTDYEEERYHACVPVVLALLDGLVNELHEKRRGFFSEEADLEAWDSVSAHSSGLQELAFLMRKSRQKTSTEPISIPYRNGILHGMDLGYDNQLVAAKTWSALFSVHDWASKAEKGLLEKTDEKPQEPSLADVIKKRQELDELNAQLEAWTPRKIKLGENIPITEEPEAYETGSPERSLVEFLLFWKKRNYGNMAKYASRSPIHKHKGLPARFKDHYSTKTLQSFEFTLIDDQAAAVTEIETVLNYEEYGQNKSQPFVFRMIYENIDGETLVRSTEGGNWIIYNWSFFF